MCDECEPMYFKLGTLADTEFAATKLLLDAIFEDEDDL